MYNTFMLLFYPCLILSQTYVISQLIKIFAYSFPIIVIKRGIYLTHTHTLWSPATTFSCTNSRRIFSTELALLWLSTFVKWCVSKH